MRFPATALLLALTAPAAADTPPAPVIPTTAEQPGQADASRVRAGTYEVDVDHTQVAWQVNHIGVSILQGMFGPSRGSLTIDPENLAATRMHLAFTVADLAVTQPGFAEHLKSSDFFDVERFPVARFASTSVKPLGGNRASVTGNLTIRNRTRPVTIDATFVGAGIHPLTKQLNIGFDGTATIKRSDFGLDMGVPVVSDNVLLDLNAAFAAP